MHTNSSQIFAAILLVATSALSAIEGRVTYLSGNADIKSSGKVTALKLDALLKEGDTVDEGQTCVILESMKMEMPVEAPQKGRVVKIHCAESQAVNEGDVLLEIE